MSSEITPKATQQLDGFDGYENAVEGQETSAQSDRGSSGWKLKFLNGVWLDQDEREIKAELVVLDVQRKVQKWLDDTGPAETIVLAPGAKFPDIDAMNAECPQSEWREKFGKLTGPWAAEHVVLFVDPTTMEKYWWPSPVTTIGSAVAVRNLVSQVKLMRQFRGQHVYPIVELSHTFMNTAYGGRERPHLEIKRWITFSGSGSEVLPAPQTASITGPTPTAASKAGANMQTVEPPSAKEVTGDEIKY